MNYKRLYDQLMVSGSKDKFPLSHGHHIIPKHIGGTDDEWNFVFLTVRQHALAHRLLWKMDGRWQDRVAWQGLAGRLNREEIIREVQTKGMLGNKNGSWEGKGKRPPEKCSRTGKKIVQRSSPIIITELGVFKGATTVAKYHNIGRRCVYRKLEEGEFLYA